MVARENSASYWHNRTSTSVTAETSRYVKKHDSQHLSATTLNVIIHRIRKIHLMKTESVVQVVGSGL